MAFSMEEKKSPYNPLIRSRFDWPFNARPASRPLSTDKKEILALLRQVAKGNMDLDDIAKAYEVDEAAITALRDQRKRAAKAPAGRKKVSNKR